MIGNKYKKRHESSTGAPRCGSARQVGLTLKKISEWLLVGGNGQFAPALKSGLEANNNGCTSGWHRKIKMMWEDFNLRKGTFISSLCKVHILANTWSTRNDRHHLSHGSLTTLKSNGFVILVSCIRWAIECAFKRIILVKDFKNPEVVMYSLTNLVSSSREQVLYVARANASNSLEMWRHA